MTRSACLTAFSRSSREVAGLDGAAVLGVDLAQRVDVQVEDGDVGAHSPGDSRGKQLAGHAAADHHHHCRGDTGDAAHQHAATPWVRIR